MQIGLVLMDSATRNEITSKGVMWELDQNLDQSMDEEAGRLRNMYREKVFFIINFVDKLGNLIYLFFLLEKGKYPSQFDANFELSFKLTIFFPSE